MSALETLAERAPAFSDEDLALRFAERHAGNLRFVAAWNRWLFWNGMHWQFEETLRAWDFAERAASYWISIREAADCGERLTVETHCRQIRLVTLAAFETVKALGSQEAEL